MAKILPKVSVHMMVYNHEKYIREAIDSVLMQKTDFPIEIVIGEDCSTDNTRNIILDYKNKHPDKFKLLLYSKNIGAMQNQLTIYDACEGKYVALLEGDDYWTDPNKLQKQVDFLDTNPNFSICSHNVNVVTEGYPNLTVEWLGKDYKETSTLEDRLKSGSGGATCSLVFRNRVFGDFPQWYKGLPGGDWTLQILCTEYGKMRYFPEIMGVYRKNPGGKSWVKTGYQEQIDIFDAGGVKICEAVNKHFNYKYDEIIKYNLTNYFYPNLLRICLNSGKINSARKYAKKILFNSSKTIKLSIKKKLSLIFILLPIYVLYTKILKLLNRINCKLLKIYKTYAN